MGKKLNLLDSDITYYPGFLSAEEAHFYFEHFRETVPWQQDSIRIFGKVHPQPRLTALFGNNGQSYSYSNITMQPQGFPKHLLDLKDRVDIVGQVRFTSCLLNLYRNGQDSNGWHSDNEKELGVNPIIASVSLGQERQFHLKHRNRPELKHKILLENGSLLVMKGETQHHWLHQVPKTSRPIGERINLTFRIII